MYKPLSLTSFRSKSSSRIKYDVIKSTITKIDKQPLVLILDDHSAKILSSFLSVSDLLSLGVFSIEALNTQREPYPQYHALYIIAPTIESCEKIVNDFSNEKKPLYKRVHIYFTHKIENDVIDTLINKTLIKRIIACKEMNLSYLIRDKNIFHLGYSNGDNLRLFSKSILGTNEYNEYLMNIKEKLITVYSVLQEYPNIQYQRNSIMCSKLAMMLNTELKQLLNNKPKQGILLLTDREIDPATPLLHDYTYQTLIYDLLDIKNGNEIHIGDTTAILNDNNDELWESYKDKHIKDVIDKHHEDLQYFMNSDLYKAFSNKNNLQSFDDMEKCLQNMIGYKAKNILLSLHLKIIQEIDTLYRQHNIGKIIDIEQCIVSGVDDSYKVMHAQDVIKEFNSIKEMLMTSNINHHYNLLRLLAVIMCYLDISEKEFNALVNGLNCDEKEMQMFMNFENFGKGFNSASSGKANRREGIHKSEIKEMKNKFSESTYKIVRSVPKLRNIVEQCGNLSLKDDVFPFVEKCENLVKGKKYGRKGLFSKTDTKDDNGNYDNDDDNSPHLVVFNIGGVSYNEISAINNLEHERAVKYKIIIGSTGIYNAKEYLNELMNMNEDKRNKHTVNVSDQLDEGDIKIDMVPLNNKK